MTRVDALCLVSTCHDSLTHSYSIWATWHNYLTHSYSTWGTSTPNGGCIIHLTSAHPGVNRISIFSVGLNRRFNICRRDWLIAHDRFITLLIQLQGIPTFSKYTFLQLYIRWPETVSKTPQFLLPHCSLLLSENQEFEWQLNLSDSSIWVTAHDWLPSFRSKPYLYVSMFDPKETRCFLFFRLKIMPYLYQTERIRRGVEETSRRKGVSGLYSCNISSDS